MVSSRNSGDLLTICLEGRIDSTNASAVEQQIRSLIAGQNITHFLIDIQNLCYISSAGLRILLHLIKNYPTMQLINANSDIYEVLEMTGFTEIITVRKTYREISIEGCEEIGRGSNGIIYRVNQDTVVKVYIHSDALKDILHEREVARLALILGIPTAISYDVVRVNDHYGSVFEMLNARSFSDILIKEPDKIDWCVQEYVHLMKTLHSTVVPKGKLPDMKKTVLSWASFLQEHLPQEAGQKLVRLVEEVPDSDCMLHGDYHTKNIVVQKDEILLIDMDTLSVGHPIFEFGSIFNAFVGFHELNQENVKHFQGFDFDLSTRFFHKVLAAYLNTDDEQKIQSLYDKAALIGYTRLIRRGIRRSESKTEQGRKELAYRTERLLTLLSQTDTLTI